MAGRSTGANMESVRRRNRASILKYLNDYGPTSRKDLAGVLGLTPAAVTQICSDLFAEGILVEQGINKDSGNVGRKKIFIDINYDAAYVIAINISPENTTVALTDLKGDALKKKRIKTDVAAEPKDFLIKLAKAGQKLLEEGNAMDERKLLAVGLGIPGIVDKEKGSSVFAYGIWKEEVAIADILSDYFDVPIYVENNVNAFAMAELLYGCGKEYDNLMVIKWGPGVGCSMVIDGEIYEGRHAKAAELGHFIVEKDGLVCKCGRRGCLETKVSYSALQKIKAFSEDDFGKVFAESTDQAEGEKFRQAMDLFARSIVNSATIMAPNRIVLTGSLFESALVRDELIKACKAYDESMGHNRILYSNLAKKEHYIGPAAVCAKQLLFS